MFRTTNPSTLHLAIPKGRIQTGVVDLLDAAGLELRSGPRGYRPVPSVAGYEVKLHKPLTIVEMLAAGSRDVGFTGADWVAETDADVIELLDTGLDPVEMVVATPEQVLENGGLPRRPLVVASEYPRLTKQWITERNLDAAFVRSYGPPRSSHRKTPMSSWTSRRPVRRARFQSGLSVMTFLKAPTWLTLHDPASTAKDAAQLARLEGLEAHARAAELRM